MNKDKELLKLIENIKKESKGHAQDAYIKELYKIHEPMVLSFINKYHLSSDLIDDFINEAHFVMYSCAINYNEDLNIKFSTYLYDALNKMITNFLSDDKLISPYLMRKIKSIEDFIEEYYRLNDKPPKIKDIADALKISESKVEEYLIYKDLKINQKLDSLEVSDTLSIENSVLLEDNLKSLNLALKKLDEIEMKIIIYRFGLDGNDKLSYEEIGKEYNLSGETIRNKYKKAINKLRKLMEEEK